VAAQDAVFVMAYSSIALSPDAGATWSLARALPRQLASEMLMNAERIGPARLKELGIVNRVSVPGAALEDALALAQSLNERAPNALASIKELLNDAAVSPLASHLADERDHFVRNLHHANAGIGIEAFLSKQKPLYE
jgi:enoyl-CoA hydratase/carnithine racemase